MADRSNINTILRISFWNRPAVGAQEDFGVHCSPSAGGRGTDQRHAIAESAVVDDLEGQARRLIAFLGLSWDEACLRFYETKRPVRTASLTQVRRPVYKSSVGRWRKYAAHLGPLLTALEIDPS